MRTVEVRGVDVVHSTGHRLAQDRQGPRMILAWPKHAATRELHGAERQPIGRVPNAAASESRRP